MSPQAYPRPECDVPSLSKILVEGFVRRALEVWECGGRFRFSDELLLLPARPTPAGPLLSAPSLLAHTAKAAHGVN